MPPPASKQARNPVVERCEAILASQRYRDLRDKPPSFEPSCPERRAAMALAPNSDLYTCLDMIPKIFQTIGSVATVLKDGTAMVRERKISCKNDKCGNTNPNRFDYRKGGMVACMECGECIEELLVEEGAQFRDFTGEESRNHHGDAPNPYMSANYNSGTTFRGYRGAKTGAARERDYSMGSQGGATTIEYKDDQKLDALRVYRTFIRNYDVHQLIMDKAMTLFAAYRDAEERVYNRRGVMAACMIAAMIEAQVEDGDGKTFVCRVCKQAFALRRDLERHACPAGGGFRRKRSTTVVDDVPAIHRMDLGEVEAYISMNFPHLSYFARGVTEGLMTEMRQEAGGDDSDDESDPAVSRLTAGQHLLLAGLPQLLQWTGGNADAAQTLQSHLNEVKEKRRERDAALLKEQMEKPRIVKRAKSVEEEAAALLGLANGTPAAAANGHGIVGVPSS